MRTERAQSGLWMFEAPLDMATSWKSSEFACRRSAEKLGLVSMGKREGGGRAQCLRVAHALSVTLGGHDEQKLVDQLDEDGHGRALLRIRRDRTRLHEGASARSILRAAGTVCRCRPVSRMFGELRWERQGP